MLKRLKNKSSWLNFSNQRVYESKFNFRLLFEKKPSHSWGANNGKKIGENRLLIHPLAFDAKKPILCVILLQPILLKYSRTEAEGYEKLQLNCIAIHQVHQKGIVFFSLSTLKTRKSFFHRNKIYRCLLSCLVFAVFRFKNDSRLCESRLRFHMV